MVSRYYSEDIPSGSEDEALSSDDDEEYQPDEDPLAHSEVDNDSGDDSDDDSPSSTMPDPHTSRRPQRSAKYNWEPGSMEYKEEDCTFLGDIRPTDALKALKTPIQLFDFFFPPDLIELIVSESMRYASQQGKEYTTSPTEIRQFIGILIYMSVIRYPTTRHYWKIGMEFDLIVDTMSCNRFEEIKRFLHFVNNDDMLQSTNPDFDKLQKIRPVLSMVKQMLLQVPKEEYLAVDEQIVPTKTSKSSLKQYNPKKPHKWGYKIYILSGVSGFSYDFDLYAGKQSDKVPENNPNLGTSSNVVLRLTESVPTHLNYKIFFDNWFTSVDLMVCMHNKGILPLGTVRSNRLGGAKLPTKKEMSREGRGSTAELHATVDDTTVAVISWLDNKVVHLCSTYVGVTPTTIVRRYDRKRKLYHEVSCPKAVQLYNRHMGGVDTLDSMLGYYRIKVRSKKWYLRVFFHIIDLVCVNSWLLWRRCNEDTYIPLLDFKLLIAEVLIKKDSQIFTPRSRGRPTIGIDEPPAAKKSKRKVDMPPREVVEDGFHHFPEWTESRQRCRNECGGQTFICCLKCKMYLCINKKRNCFLEYHVPTGPSHLERD